MPAKKTIAGFASVEAVFALFLIAASLVVYASSLSLVRLLRSTKNQNLAYHIAVKEMENLRATSFTSLPPSGPFSDPDMAALAGGSGWVQVTPIDSSLVQTAVTVSWNESGVAKTVDLTTLIYAGGINTL